MMKFLHFKRAYKPLGNPSLYIRPDEIVAIQFQPHDLGGPTCALTLSNGASLSVSSTDEALFSLMGKAGVDFEILASAEVK